MQETEVVRDLFCLKCGCFLSRSQTWEEIKKHARAHGEAHPDHRLYAPAVKRDAVDFFL